MHLIGFLMHAGMKISTSPIDCYLSVVEGFAFSMILKALPSRVFNSSHGCHGVEVEGEKKTKAI